MKSGIEILPSRPFSADELREFLLGHSECQTIYLFPEASLEAVCVEFGFARRVTRKVVALDLAQTEEALWAGMDAKRRNGIRYSRKHGVIARPATPDDLDAAINVMVKGYFAKFNRPTDNIRGRVGSWIAAGGFLLAQLGADGPVIAGVRYRDASYAPDEVRYFQSGIYSVYADNTSLIEYQKYKPNDLLVWEAALRSKSEGYKEFLLGGETALFKREFSRRRIAVDEWVRTPSQ